MSERKKINCHVMARVYGDWGADYQTPIAQEINAEANEKGKIVGVGCERRYMDSSDLLRCRISEDEKTILSTMLGKPPEEIEDGYCIHRVADEL